MKTNLLNHQQMELLMGGQKDDDGNVYNSVPGYPDAHYTGDPRTNPVLQAFVPCFWGGMVVGMGAVEGMAGAMG